MQGEIGSLKKEMAFLKDAQREEGKVAEIDKQAMKEEITKTLTQELEGKIKATKEGWVEVMKKSLKIENKEHSSVVVV